MKKKIEKGNKRGGGGLPLPGWFLYERVYYEVHLTLLSKCRTIDCGECEDASNELVKCQCFCTRK